MKNVLYDHDEKTENMNLSIYFHRASWFRHGTCLCWCRFRVVEKKFFRNHSWISLSERSCPLYHPVSIPGYSPERDRIVIKSSCVRVVSTQDQEQYARQVFVAARGLLWRPCRDRRAVGLRPARPAPHGGWRAEAPKPLSHQRGPMDVASEMGEGPARVDRGARE